MSQHFSSSSVIKKRDKLDRMKATDVAHIASLARIRVSESEQEQLASELETIVSYVDAVSSIATDESDAVPQVGVRHNVLREDVVTNEPEQFTDALLREMPEIHNRYLKVKKILHVK